MYSESLERKIIYFWIVKYNYFITDIFTDKNEAKEKFKVIENIFVSYLNYKYLDNNTFDENIVSILKDISYDQILNSISILEEELPKLDFNVNFKLWLDSLFSRLVIGG